MLVTDKKFIKCSKLITKDFIPHLLFHGPPGTGKTTTIINLIKNYQTLNDCKNKDLIIHLNASDDRGVDIVRNQINQFVFYKYTTLYFLTLKYLF